jgi:hypothetical protein
MGIQYTGRTTHGGGGVRVVSKAFLKSESNMKVTVSRKNFMRMEKCAILSGNMLFAIALSDIYTLTFMFNTADKQMLVRC